MARLVKRLSARQVANAKPPKGRRAALIADGGNLFLQVSTGKDGNVRRSWVFQFELASERGWRGLGPTHTFSLHEARDKAKQLRQQLKAGIAPPKAKTVVQQQKLEAAKQMTFGQCVDAYLETHDAAWKNVRHAAQWRSTLTEYCQEIADLPVKSIDTDLILRVLTPIWKTKTVTADRLRGRIERVLSWAKGRDLRSGENPARWPGHLDEMLPAPGKIAKIEHHPALPYPEMPRFMAELRSRDLLSARALEFTILTAARTSEALQACWSEIDFDAKVWTVPADRIKAARDHRVPLSDRAIAILKEQQAHRHGNRIFNLADGTMRAMLRRMGVGAVPHGFRSTFKDWASERTSFENHVSEAALAHAVGDKVEAAYRRGDALDKRRKLMEAWSRYCAQPPVGAAGNVTPIRSGSGR
jgi:integrase